MCLKHPKMSRLTSLDAVNVHDRADTFHIRNSVGKSAVGNGDTGRRIYVKDTLIRHLFKWSLLGCLGVGVTHIQKRLPQPLYAH